MDLIKEIEIAYFRSIYKERVAKFSGTNVVFGRNDAGKSNVLRALNLFFNNESNPDLPFSFSRDFSRARQAEIDERGGKGRKNVYVKIWFRTPTNWRSSLGDEFWVKKQWNVTSDSEPERSSSITRDNGHYLSRFLNRIQFHYVPAIKDRKIFERLLAELYRVIAEEQQFVESLEVFTDELRARTAELSENLGVSLGLKSVISPPDDLTHLFKSLDFHTIGERDTAYSYSLTLQRGDGIQMRHIPEILAFLSDNDRRREFHIWGFEEPENSLELANAIEEAERFVRYGRDGNKQIFLTSHSPAFFALESSEASRYFVTSTNEDGVADSSAIRDLGVNNDDPHQLMGELPHLSVVSSSLRSAQRKIEELNSTRVELESSLDQYHSNILFVEGITDRQVFEASWELLRRSLGGQEELRVIAGGGTDKMHSLARPGRVLSEASPARRLFIVVDNDEAGRALSQNIKHKDPEGGIWTPHKHNDTWWCRLPYSEEMTQTMISLGIQQNKWPGCIENIFSIELRKRARADGAYSLSCVPFPSLMDSGNYERIHETLFDETDDRRFYTLSPEPESKTDFSAWLVEKSEVETGVLAPIVSVLKEMMLSDDRLK